jgi:hypothetical protein
MVRRVRDRLDFALPVIRASSSSEPGACSASTHSLSRLPAESTLAKDSEAVNQTFGLSVHDAPLAAGDGHGAGLHGLVAGDADFQGRHKIAPFSRRTASAVAQMASSKVAAPGRHRAGWSAAGGDGHKEQDVCGLLCRGAQLTRSQDLR